MVKALKDSWNSRMGVILAVSGSAVGLGNFLRFPGQVAQYGGGSFMIAYFISFLLIGLPICWAEWTMGRYGGQRGFHTTVGIFHSILRHPAGKYLGIIGIIIPVIIYMYYVLIEAWCLGYAVNFLAGNMNFESSNEAGAFFSSFTGVAADGAGMGFSGISQVGLFLIFCFLLNFYLIFRGIAKGIEWFCRYAMPTLVILAFVVLIRVLTLGTPDADDPQRSISAGLGFMWNPSKTLLVEETVGEAGEVVTTSTPIFGSSYIEEQTARADREASVRIEKLSLWDQLANPQLWLAAAGQIFFSLSVGFGVIVTYSSYMSNQDDVVLSGLAATSANEFCEVALGGLITIPASVAFLGVMGISGALGSTFALGFNVLPMVFAEMPFGQFFGFIFFFLLFLAAVTSSLSMLQPGIAFLETAMYINRKQSVAILGFITGFGCMIIFYFSKDFKALDTFDFWIGTFMIFVLATIQIVFFSWIMGIDRGFEEAHKGAHFKIPRFFGYIMKYVTPVFLLIIFTLWLAQNLFGYNIIARRAESSSYYNDLFGADPNPVAWISVSVIVMFGGFVALVVNSSSHYRKQSHAAQIAETTGGKIQ